MTPHEIALDIFHNQIPKMDYEFEDSIDIVEKALIQYAKQEREKALREAAEIGDEQIRIFNRIGVIIHPNQIGNAILSLIDKEGK